MNIWLEAFQPLLVTSFIALLMVAAAVFLWVGLSSLVSWIRSAWAARGARSLEEQAVDDVALYQGRFHMPASGVVRREFGRRFELRFDNHWACAGSWKRDKDRQRSLTG